MSTTKRPSWVIHKFKYQKIASSIESAATLSTKDSLLWKVVAAVVMVCTFGGISRRKFLEEYATTFGPLQAYPRYWPSLSTRLLVHECRHTTQCLWFGYAVPIAGWFFGRRVRAWCGLPLYGIVYLLLFLPLGFAYFRYLFERDADRVAYRWALEEGYTPKWVTERARSFGLRVCGGNYGWSWPAFFGVNGFVKVASEEIERWRNKSTSLPTSRSGS